MGSPLRVEAAIAPPPMRHTHARTLSTLNAPESDVGIGRSSQSDMLAVSHSCGPSRFQRPLVTSRHAWVANLAAQTSVVRQACAVSRLDDVMSGFATFSGSEVVATSTNTVMAVDAVELWGAVFELQIAAKGSYNEQALIAFRSPGCDWVDLMSGGGHGDGWATPWSPPETGWDHGHLLVSGTTGTTGFVDDEDFPLTAIYGFASPQVQSVRVEQRSAVERSIEPTSCGAWIVLVVGPEPAALTPTSADGTPLPVSQRVDAKWFSESE